MDMLKKFITIIQIDMKVVVCINDKNQPVGANIVEGKEYEVEQEYLNALDQRVYIIKGAVNEGTTKWGMRWIGYDAMRFSTQDSVEIEEKEYMFALN
jgi:hypothetical protein